MDGPTIQAIVTAIFGLATTFLTVIVAPIVLKQAKVADGKLDQQARDALYPALQYAISYAQAKLTGDQNAQLAASDQLKQHAVSLGRGYIKAKLPDALERLGVTDAALDDLLLSRLQSALDYAKTYVTPAAPASEVKKG